MENDSSEVIIGCLFRYSTFASKEIEMIARIMDNINDDGWHMRKLYGLHEEIERLCDVISLDYDHEDGAEKHITCNEGDFQFDRYGDLESQGLMDMLGSLAMINDDMNNYRDREMVFEKCQRLKELTKKHRMEYKD